MNRPPKFAKFRIPRREITIFSPDGEQILLRKICGRIMIRPYKMHYEVFLHGREKGRPFRAARCLWGIILIFN